MLPIPPRLALSHPSSASLSGCLDRCLKKRRERERRAQQKDVPVGEFDAISGAGVRLHDALIVTCPFSKTWFILERQAIGGGQSLYSSCSATAIEPPKGCRPACPLDNVVLRLRRGPAGPRPAQKTRASPAPASPSRPRRPPPVTGTLANACRCRRMSSCRWPSKRV